MMTTFIPRHYRKPAVLLILIIVTVQWARKTWNEQRFVEDIVTLLIRLDLRLSKLQSRDDFHSAYNEIAARRATFLSAIRQRATVYYVIYLTVVDRDELDVAVNLHETSFQPHGIDNYLFTSLSQEVCDDMAEYDIACVAYLDVEVTESTSSNAASLMRTLPILESLRAGYTVVHADVDLVFLDDPVNYLTSANRAADLKTMADNDNFINPGLLFIRPTLACMYIYRSMFRALMAGSETGNQARITSVIQSEELQKKYSFKLHLLDQRIFRSGVVYFESEKNINPHFALENYGKNLMVLHNNKVESHTAKVYRLREALMWFYDGKDQYYTHPTRKYLTYENIVRAGFPAEPQLRALRNALAVANLLDRTLILPRFHCASGACALSSYLAIDAFDAQFASLYRESSFLFNIKVPSHITLDVSDMYHIDVLSVKETRLVFQNRSKKQSKWIRPAIKSRGFTERTLMFIFGKLRRISVLRFTHMENVFGDHKFTCVFQEKIKKGFVKSKEGEANYNNNHYTVNVFEDNETCISK